MNLESFLTSYHIIFCIMSTYNCAVQGASYEINSGWIDPQTQGRGVMQQNAKARGGGTSTRGSPGAQTHLQL